MIAAIGSTIPILIMLTGLIYATSVFRIARALGLDVMVSDFVEAAPGAGRGPVVDHYPRDPPQRGDADGDRLRPAVRPTSFSSSRA